MSNFWQLVPLTFNSQVFFFAWVFFLVQVMINNAVFMSFKLSIFIFFPVLGHILFRPLLCYDSHLVGFVFIATAIAAIKSQTQYRWKKTVCKINASKPLKWKQTSIMKLQTACVCTGAGWRTEVTCPRHVAVLVKHTGRVWCSWCLESWHRCWVRRLQREMSTCLSSPHCMWVRDSVWGK